MAARRMKVLVGVRGFGVEICGDMAVCLLDGDIQEVGLIWGEIRSELDGPVKRIHVVDECVEAVFVAGPDEEDVVNVAPPDPWTARS